MPIISTITRWLQGLFKKENRDDLLTGVSSTPDFPDPTALIAWILMSYRQGVDTAACFSLEHIPDPYIRLVYANRVEITVCYPPPFSPIERLKAIGLALPRGFTLTDWKRHHQFTLTGGRLPPDDLAEFIDLLFRKLYHAEPGYVMAAWTDIHPQKKVPPPTPQKNATPYTMRL